MMYLVDTNVVSELRNLPRADKNVRAWEAGVNPSWVYISVISIFELELGTRHMERRDPAQGQALRTWLDLRILPAFDGRILPVDVEVVVRCAAINVSDRQPFRDSLIAATALVHGMTVVTRNVTDFAPTGVAVLNPWKA
jgi:predicted nucleic acid-binding protein